MPAEFQRVKELFLAALEKDQAAERSAYLDAACGVDRDLRQRVDVLLARHEAAGSFLESPASAGVATVDEQPLGEGPGTVIGPYKLLEQIGEGGFGVVFMAEQQQPIRRKVALKVLKPGMDTRQVIARFEAERQALALMDHPNIAKVLDGGATASGRPYFVMDLVKGMPITDFCDQNHLTPRQRLELFVPVCQAVQHAHHKGIIHRDLKPSNVLVSMHDATPVVKVIDFGVAKALGQELTDKTLFTGFAQMIGTPLYMSPEQAGESGLDIDTRSDIYSLGVLLYELLTGTTPFNKERFKEVGYDEIRRIIREEEPPKPSTRISTLGQAATTVSTKRKSDPKRLSQLFRGELDWIVMKALEKDRNRRYETASAFAADVQHYLHDEPVLACPPSPWYRFRKFARRNRGRLAVAAGVFVAVTIVAATIGWAVRDRAAREAEIEQAEKGRRARVERQVRGSVSTARALIAENRLGSARQKLAEARAQLGDDRSLLDSLGAEIDGSETEFDRFQQFLELIDRAHQAETAPILEVTSVGNASHDRARTQPAATRWWDRRPAAAVPFLLEALKRYAILERDDWNTILEVGLLGRDQVEHVRRTAYEELLWLADDVLRRQEEHRSEQKLPAEEAAHQALVYLGKAERAHRPTQALYALRARCRKAQGEDAAALADRQLADKTRPTIALDHYLRGQAAYDAKQLAEAVQAFEAALRLEPTHYWSMMHLGYCSCDLGQRQEDFTTAVVAFTGCILKRPDHAHAHYCRANAYSKLRRYEVAVADYSKAIELDPDFTSTWKNRALAYGNLNQPAKAVADLDRVIALKPDHVDAWINRGIAYIHLDQPAKAAADFARAIELKPDDVEIWIKRGNAYDKLGQQAKAIADFTKVIELKPSYVEAWYDRGNAYRVLGQLDNSVADYSKALELKPDYVAALINRGIAYGQLGQAAKALADLTRAIELKPDDAEAWINRGNVYRMLGQPENAIADLTKGIELEPDHAKARYNRAVVYSKLGELDKAIADYSKAIELDPDFAEAWNNRGIDRLASQPDQALADLDQAVKLKPGFAESYYNRGNAHFQLRRHDKAVADYSKALELKPDLPQIWNNRGIAYCALSQWANAISDFSKVSELTPGSPSALNQLAWLLATCPEVTLRSPTRAIELAEKAVELAPEQGMYWNTLGAAHYRAGDWKVALSALEHSMKLRRGGDASDWFFLAMAHWRLGQKEEARPWYDKAVQWMEKNAAKNVELRRLRDEAEELMGVKKKT
jgi:tetratricopeptide (TPR) repeat protein